MGIFDRFRDWLSHGHSAPPAHFIWPTRQHLHDDFEARSWDYERSKRDLIRSNPRLLDWLGTIDGSGHVRERSLLHLIEHFQPGDENRILLRLADWVPEVRALATEWTLVHFRDLPQSALKENEKLLLYLSRKQHLAGHPALALIHQELVRRLEEGPEFASGFSQEFRRALFERALAQGSPARAWILDDPDPFVRVLLLGPNLRPPLRAEESTRLRSDRSVRVRRKWLAAQSAAGARFEESDLVQLAFDRNRGVRALARFHLERDFGVDAYGLYRAAEGDAFFFLADYQRAEDLTHFLEALRSKRSAVRLLGLRALCGCCPEALQGLDPSVLLADARKVRNLALTQLPTVLSLHEIESLRGVVEGLSERGRDEFLGMVLRKSAWRYLDLALEELLEAPRPALVDQVSQVVANMRSPQPIAAAMRESILERSHRLSESKSPWLREVGRQIHFTARTAPQV